MRFLPQTLLWRTFLLIASLMVAAVLAWVTLFIRAEREPRAQQLAQMVASVVNLTRSALISAQPDRRRELLLELSDREGIRVYPAEEDDAVAPLPEDAPLLQLVAAEVRRQLGPETRFSLAHEGEAGFWVSFRIDGVDEYWLMLPAERVVRANPLRWLGWGAATLLLALAGAYLIVFRITRPLKGLAAAAADIGLGRHPVTLKESGPGEIRQVTRAFNEMSNDLARLDEDRALILAGISHDLRTPLTRLRLAAEMSADETARGDIAADIDEMDKIIGQFLDFARDAEGEAPEPTDLNAVVRHIAEPLLKRGAALVLRLDHIPFWNLRPLGMLRVAANLINNALLYGGETAPVEIVTRREDDVLVLEVMDRGPGVPPEEVERLKRPFARLENARTDTGGAGLGLAIVDRIARSHGGRLELLAREGGGLIARVSLPIGQA